VGVIPVQRDRPEIPTCIQSDRAQAALLPQAEATITRPSGAKNLSIKIMNKLYYVKALIENS